MTFCPRCGAPLKGQAAGAQTGPPPAYRKDEKAEKNEKDQHNEKNEKQEKGAQGFMGFLIGGLVLIIIGIFSLLSVAGIITGGLNGALVLVLIGVVIIIAAIYFANTAKKRSPSPIR